MQEPLRNFSSTFKLSQEQQQAQCLFKNHFFGEVEKSDIFNKSIITALAGTQLIFKM